MKLHEIITINSDVEKSILFESILPYKRALYTYYKREFNCEPVLMVTDVFNAAQYVKIVPCNELTEAIYEYLQSGGIDGSEIDSAIETISFNSRMYKDILPL